MDNDRCTLFFLEETFLGVGRGVGGGMLFIVFIQQIQSWKTLTL